MKLEEIKRLRIQTKDETLKLQEEIQNVQDEINKVKEDYKELWRNEE